MSSRIGTFLSTSLLLLLPAVAQAAGDRVDLKDGSFYRGEILEKVVGDHVTIRLETGEIKRIPWGDVKWREAAPSRYERSTRSNPGTVRVHLAADSNDAELQRYQTTTSVDVVVATPNGGYVGRADVDVYAPVCTAPCDVDVDESGTYRVGGPGLVPTDGFHLQSGVRNDVDASLSTTFHKGAGKTLTYLGIPITLVGGLLWGLASTWDDTVACAGCANWHASGVRTGTVVTGVGAVLLTTGIVLWATSGSSASIGRTSVALNRAGTVRLGGEGLQF